MHLPKLFALFILGSFSALSVGCGDNHQVGPGRDLSAMTPLDLSSTADLSESRDLGRSPAPVHDLAWSSCIGTRLAGTCAERFFEPFVACFQPAGHCQANYHNSVDYLWDSGARHSASLSGLMSYGSKAGGCLYRYILPAGPTPVPTAELLCPANDPSCELTLTDGGVPVGGARYDHVTGIFVCPDGTSVDIGPSPNWNVGDCAVLNELLNPVPLCDGAA